MARFWKGLGQPARRGADEGASSKSSPKAGGALTPFPKDYAQMVSQCQKALQAGLDDGLGLMEIQFPPGGLETAPGDVEGNMESNLTVQHLRGICAQFERNKTAKTTRVFFPINRGQARENRHKRVARRGPSSLKLRDARVVRSEQLAGPGGLSRVPLVPVRVRPGQGAEQTGEHGEEG